MIADLHVHTRYSFDSLSEPRDALRAARAKGLGAVAITDHNTIAGALVAQSLAAGTSLRVIVGEEIATDRGDLVALFLEREVEPGPAVVVADAVHSLGGLLVLPHPYRGHAVTVDLVKAVDLIEGFNARTKPELNAAALALARAHGKPALAVSDAHFLREIGNSAVSTDEKDIREALRWGNFTRIERYNPAFLLPASQIIKSMKLKTYRRIPKLMARTVAAMVLGR